MEDISGKKKQPMYYFQESKSVDVQESAKLLAKASGVVALTGAGISVASGIRPFRGKGGLWEKYDPEEVANINNFIRNPAASWVALKEIMDVVEVALPNPAHLALAALEQMGILRSVITQNVDGLHQEAGNSFVIEFHGNTRRTICLECRAVYAVGEINMDSLPPYCPACDGVLKPDAVFFGETIPRTALEQARTEIQSCRIALVIGTSGMVEPAASLPFLARDYNAVVIEINPERSFLTPRVDYFLEGRAEEVLPLLVEQIKNLAGK